MTYHIVKLYFRQPVHFSRGKMNTYESSSIMLHSDTIQAALYVSAIQLHGMVVAEKFRRMVRVSSAFPFTQDSGLWLPKPLAFNLKDTEHQKELKKLRFLRLNQFERLINGKMISVSDVLEMEQPEIWKEDTTQRVMLDRKSNRGMPFYLEKLYPMNSHKDRGLYFLVHVEEEGFPELKSLLKLLSDNGFGLQRSLGNGAFYFEIEENGFSIELPEKPTAWINLSLYRPTNAEIACSRFNASSYRLIKRGGWIANASDDRMGSLRKKAVMMFAEGSVLTFDNAAPEAFVPYGTIEDLQPEWEGFPHPIWRDGRGVLIPMQ